MINTHPKVCNLCGGAVQYTSNAVIYGREYGSGRCYLCTSCGAFVGTHKPWPREALFDSFWRGKRKAQKKREDLYFWLSEQMGISREDCHFGYFDLEQLRQAYRILQTIQRQEMRYDSYGNLYFSMKDGGKE